MRKGVSKRKREASDLPGQTQTTGETLAGRGMSMCPPQDTDQGGLSIGDSPGLLSGMLVLSCSADVNCDNGQELDFLVWLLPPRPLECEGDRARGPRTGEGKVASRPPP